MKIEIDDGDFELDGVKYAAFVVNSVGFKALTECVTRSEVGAGTSATGRAKRLFRERLKLQMRVETSDGKQVTFDDEKISRIPLKYGMKLRGALDAALISTGKPEILTQGDGIGTPVHIRLGTPIPVAKGDPIAELEFKAQTVGQLEDAIVAETTQEQALALLAIARPVSGSLHVMPSWAIDQITVSDGVFVMTKVLPGFFGQAES